MPTLEDPFAPCPGCGSKEPCRCLIPPKDHPNYPYWEKQLLPWEINPKVKP